MNCFHKLSLVVFALSMSTTLTGQVAPAPATPDAGHVQPSGEDQNRDLTFKKTTPSQQAQTTVQIPRSYALVIGISKYDHLPAERAVGVSRLRCRIGLHGA